MASDQHALNRQTWDALQAHGVEPGSSLDVEAFFFSPTEQRAAGLAEALRAIGWRARTSSTTRGLLRRRVEWSVEGARQIDAVDLDSLDAMVDALDALAAGHGSEFDGWGTEIGD
jgi:hypothetical protein